MKLNIGAGGDVYDGWTAVNYPEFDAANPECWNSVGGQVTHILAEHVLEHIEPELIPMVAKLMYQSDARVRIAVPDGRHPDDHYQEHVRPPNDGHKALWDYKTLPVHFLNAGFTVRLLEWWDDSHDFNWKPWFSCDGHVKRSMEDSRNVGTKLNYTSLIFDAYHLRSIA